MTMPEINRRQAMVPRGAAVLSECQRHRTRPVHRDPATRSRAAARAATRADSDARTGPCVSGSNGEAPARGYSTRGMVRVFGRQRVAYGGSRAHRCMPRGGARAPRPMEATILAARGADRLAHYRRTAADRSGGGRAPHAGGWRTQPRALGDDAYSVRGESGWRIVGAAARRARMAHLAAAESSREAWWLKRLTDYGAGSSAYVDSRCRGVQQRGEDAACSLCRPRLITAARRRQRAGGRGDGARRPNGGTGAEVGVGGHRHRGAHRRVRREAGGHGGVRRRQPPRRGSARTRRYSGGRDLRVTRHRPATSALRHKVRARADERADPVRRPCGSSCAVDVDNRVRGGIRRPHRTFARSDRSRRRAGRAASAWVSPDRGARDAALHRGTHRDRASAELTTALKRPLDVAPFANWALGGGSDCSRRAAAHESCGWGVERGG